MPRDKSSQVGASLRAAKLVSFNFDKPSRVNRSI